MWLKLDLKIVPEKPENIVVLNYKDKVGQQNFMRNTSNTSEFTTCLKSKLPVKDKMNKWKHLLDKHCNIAFPKIRIIKNNLKPSKADHLINERNILLKSNNNNQAYLDNLNVMIANTIAE